MADPPAADRQALDLENRLALNIKEAAAALGVSDRLIRSQLSEIPHVHIGGRVVFPVDALREWLNSKAREEAGAIDRAANEILASLRSR